jgi:hypothetical protein
VHGILVMELNAGQMIEDVRLAIESPTPVVHYGRLGGIVPNPAEVWEAMKSLLHICPGQNPKCAPKADDNFADHRIAEIIDTLNQMNP